MATDYQLGFPVVLVPLLVNAMLLLVLNIRRYVLSDEANFNLGTDLKFLVLFGVIQIGFLPARLFSLMGSARYPSESYAVKGLLMEQIM